MLTATISRSSGSRPPQIPQASPLFRASVPHWCRTQHRAHKARHSRAISGVGSMKSRSSLPLHAAVRHRPAILVGMVTLPVLVRGPPSWPGAGGRA